jgi:hypothetical protein
VRELVAIGWHSRWMMFLLERAKAQYSLSLAYLILGRISASLCVSYSLARVQVSILLLCDLALELRARPVRAVDAAANFYAPLTS